MPRLNKNEIHDIWWLAGGRLFQLKARKDGDLDDWYWRLCDVKPEDRQYVFKGMTVSAEEAHATKEKCIEKAILRQRRHVNNLMNQIQTTMQNIKKIQKL